MCFERLYDSTISNTDMNRDTVKFSTTRVDLQ